MRKNNRIKELDKEFKQFAQDKFNNFIERASVWVKSCDGQIKYEIDMDAGLPFDYSGLTFDSGKKIAVRDYQKVSELCKLYTGKKEATHNSHYGWNHILYQEEMQNFIFAYLWHKTLDEFIEHKHVDNFWINLLSKYSKEYDLIYTDNIKSCIIDKNILEPQIIECACDYEDRILEFDCSLLLDINKSLK